MIRKKRRTSKIGDNEKGQSMVEFALILPILILLLCGICEFGWLFSNKIMADNACREAVRYAAVHYNDDGLTDVQAEATTIATNYSGFFTVLVTVPSSEEIKVSLTGEVPLLTPFFGFLDDGTGCFDLATQCTMRIE